MARTASPVRPVLIRLTGAFGVERGGAALDDAEIGSRKARRLLALLAARRGEIVAVDEIVTALWAEAAPADPQAVVASLVSRLRRTLGSNLIEGGRAGYRLGGPPDVVVDVDRAWALAEEAERRLAAGAPALGVAAAQAALRQLRDGIGPDEAVDAEAGALRRRARHALADAALHTGDGATARDAAAAAVAADSLDEPAARLLMSAYLSLDEPSRALRAYEALSQELAGQLGTDPAPATRELHLTALRGADLVTPARPSRPSEELGLVGRDAELGRLREAWTETVGGRGGRVLITGEAGIGKTRLAEELSALVTRTGGLVAAGRCFAAERSLFAQAVVEALAAVAVRIPVGQVRAAAAGHVPTLARLLPDLTDVLGAHSNEPPQAGEQERRFAALAGFLNGLSRTNPVLLVVDDLQHAASSTLQLLHHFGRMLANRPVLVVATLREDEGRDALTMLAPHSVVQRLGPLAAPAVAELVARAGQSLRGAEIARRTGGHPLFLMETLHALTAGQLGLPATLQAAVLDRVARTGSDTERLLRAGAVLGAAFEPALAAALIGVPEAAALPALERGLAAHLLVPNGREYQFAHDVVREVLLETTPSPTRLAYHRRAADLLSGDPEAVAGHAEAIGDFSRAGRAWVLAGEQAMARFAAADAATLATRAISVAAEAELRGRALITRGRSRDAAAQYLPALADFESAREAAREAGDRRLEMTVLRELSGDVPIALGQPPATCERPLLECLALARSLGDRSIEADVLDRLAVLACARLDFADAQNLGARAVAAGRSAADEHALACGLDAVKTSFAYLGDIPALVPVLDELEPLLRRRGDLWMLQWTIFERAFVPLAAEDYDAAIAAMDSAIEVGRRSGYRAYDAFFLAHVGWAHRLAGRFDRAVEVGRRAVTDGEQYRHTWWSTTASSLLAGTLLANGQPDDARKLATGVRAIASAPGAEAYLLRCLGVLAPASGSLEVLEAADALLRRITTPPGRAWLLGADAYLGVARALAAAGRHDRAAAAVAPFRVAAVAAGWPALVRLADEL